MAKVLADGLASEFTYDDDTSRNLLVVQAAMRARTTNASLAGHPTWTEVQLQPGTLIPWTNGSQLVVLTPTTIAGNQVSKWWTAAQARQAVGLTPARLAALEQFTTQVLMGQHTQTSDARAYTEGNSHTDPVYVISSDDEF